MTLNICAWSISKIFRVTQQWQTDIYFDLFFVLTFQSKLFWSHTHTFVRKLRTQHKTMAHNTNDNKSKDEAYLWKFRRNAFRSHFLFDCPQLNDGLLCVFLSPRIRKERAGVVLPKLPIFPLGLFICQPTAKDQ